MVFGKKKNKKPEKKNETKKTEAKLSSKKVKRRASYVSTPIRSKKPSKTRKSLNRNSFVKKKPAVQQMKQPNKEKALAQAMVQNGKHKAKNIHCQGLQNLQVPKYRYQPANIPPAPPPPPPPPAQPPNNGHQPRSNKRLNHMQDKLNRGVPNQNRKPPTNRPEEPRDRTSSDVTRWLQWRQGVNEHLASYVLSGGDRQQDANTMANFPKDFTAETIDAILHHAHTKETPKTSLDKLSYMIYGIPRISLREKVSGHHMFSHDSSYADSFSDELPYFMSPKQPYQSNDISRNSSQISTGRLPRREVKGNLFIQTNPPSNIQRFLPEPRLENQYQGNEEGRDASTRLSRSSSRSYATYHPEPHSPMSSRGKPPMVGAVPTLLSGLQPYEMAHLRPITRDRRY